MFEAPDEKGAVDQAYARGYVVGAVKEWTPPAMPPVLPPAPPPPMPRHPTSARSVDEQARVAMGAWEIVFIVIGGLISVGAIAAPWPRRFLDDNAWGATANALDHLSRAGLVFFIGGGMIAVAFASYACRMLAVIVTTIERLGQAK